MAKTRPIGGYGDVRVGDQHFLFKGELTWNFQTAKKEGVAGRNNQVHGYTTTPAVPFIKGKFTFIDLTTAQLEAIQSATVSVTLATGGALVLRGAFVSGDITPGGDEGEVELTFQGLDGEELNAPGA